MDAAQAEAWTLDVVDRVQKGEPTEDTRVELKSEWIDPASAARRLGGHANAAAGEHLLWIFGLDEDRGVVGATKKELSNWWPQVQSCFDGFAPKLVHDLATRAQWETIVALQFDTDRAPYVVTNPRYGRKGGGPVEREVPWREATGTQSARREDLIRILEPVRRLPDVELLAGGLNLKVREQEPEERPTWQGRVHLQLYVVPFGRERVVIPYHRCRCSVELDEYLSVDNLSVQLGVPKKGGARWGSVSFGARNEPEVDSHTIRESGSEILVDGPGKAYLNSYFDHPIPADDPPDHGAVEITFGLVHARAPLVLDVAVNKAIVEENRLVYKIK